MKQTGEFILFCKHSKVYSKHIELMECTINVQINKIGQSLFSTLLINLIKKSDIF